LDGFESGQQVRRNVSIFVSFPWGRFNFAWGIVDPDQGSFDLQRARFVYFLFRDGP
jgi:hypothetical protein